MVSLIGACAFSIVILLSLLIMCGFPLGEFTMGGKYKVFPKKLRIIVAIQIVLQLFFLIVILQMGGFIPLWFSAKATKVIGVVMSVYLSFNVIMNLMSKSKKEKYVMTPISLIAAMCFWIVSLQL